jgi:hypothetical protein
MEITNELSYTVHMATLICKQDMLYSPSSMDPAISNSVPKQHACLMVRTFEPTGVAKELGTLLAPMPKAKTNPIVKLMMTIHSMSSEYGSIMVECVLVLHAVSCRDGADAIECRRKPCFPL